MHSRFDFHIFYYIWWGNPQVDGRYRHWQNNGHDPAAGDLCSDFRPLLGAYSSRDDSVLRQHMAWIAAAGIGTIVISWWGRGSYEDYAVASVMATAAEQGLKCCFMLEPYAGIGPASITSDIRYLIDTYGRHPAFYRSAKADKWGLSLQPRPVFYTYDFYTFGGIWQIMKAIRGTSYEAIFIANNSPPADCSNIDPGRYDGFYNYGIAEEDGTHFATVGLRLRGNSLLWSPSIGPGYSDKTNGGTGSVARRQGDHLREMFQRAAASYPSFIAITSFNEWHEGTQIEPAFEYGTLYIDVLGELVTKLLNHHSGRVPLIFNS
jgi:glycoprotein endo-alpha-1,2-mannosidase